MPSRQKGNMTTSFKNPFDDYNANVLAPDLIMQYWCTPFCTGALKEFDEKKFFAEKMPIVLQGSRGSGKTTILKYFSFPVQCERAVQSGISVKQQIKHDAGVGFYLRCDDSFLNMFKTVFAKVAPNTWEQCFKHYLELFFAKSLVELVQKIKDELDISMEEFVRHLSLENLDEKLRISSLSDLEKYIDAELRYINKYKNEALFTNAPFSPQNVWDFYELSGLLITTIKNSAVELRQVNFLLLVDEFENLPVELQKMFNTMVKFCKPGMSMRIGRRSENENIVTKATINSVEYLREGNDYRLIVLDQEQDIQEIKPYLFGIAQKRLEAFDGIDISNNLEEILGEKEDLNSECERIAAKKEKHLEYLLCANSRLAKEDDVFKQIVDLISYPENVIAESLCALWVARTEDGEDLLLSAKQAAGAMRAYFDKTQHPLKDKFSSDYNNKYRYALTTAICAAYKKDKAYYSFNTLCYLSEGNARTFINLCKAIISDALFYEKKQFFDSGKISVESQSRAIKEYATSEFDSVCSIIQKGKSIRNLILSIGNILSDYHKDRMVRYPETTQFSYTYEDLEQDSKAVVDIAESWALLKRGKETKRLSASIGQEGYLYTINRIFAPIFNTSYRIRGGFNEFFSAEEINQMIAGQKITKLSVIRKKRTRSSPPNDEARANKQMSMFDGGNVE